MVYFLTSEHVSDAGSTVQLPNSENADLLFVLMTNEYDVIVIGGGSGGLAAAKAAAGYKKKVALLDSVAPSKHGNVWGIGGTCVNVGCIPKRLFHDAAGIAEQIHDAPAYGFENASTPQLNWGKLVDNVSSYIRRLNRAYKTELKWNDYIDYYNAEGSFVSANEVKLNFGPESDKGETIITGEHIVIATGGRPIYPDIPNAELGITSDDIFRMKKSPGKICIIGASYIALECAGFLNSLGFDTTVLVRSIILRGFDQQIAGMIGGYMENTGVKFLKGKTPMKLDKLDDDKILVHWQDGSDVFDTVLFATGRAPNTGRLNLEAAGVRYHKKTGKIMVNKETTNVKHIHAVGDVVKGGVELTPVAIQSAKLLINRLFGNESRSFQYSLVPTTVFTPLEYGAIGVSEEDAIAQYGETGVNIYHVNFQPLEWALPSKPSGACYCKLICAKEENDRVVGFHYLGPNAAEVTQGYGVAIRMGATKSDIDWTPGIHPSNSETFVSLNITKESGESSKRETAEVN
ncbi:hypothetical protein GEMRC1_003711 [Eukaryota sp. GEM-RC1]